jgi:trans-aconitate methyltransferase
MPAQDYYRKWAAFHAGEAALKKMDAVALVEGKTDKPFWAQLFRHAQKKVRIIAGSDTETHTGGKQECLKYARFVSAHFCICIDSDYDYIRRRRPPACKTPKGVLQTYAYAIENHYLAANAGLQDFLKKYSAVIYPAFLAFLAYGGRMAEHSREFNSDIAFADRRDTTLDALQKNLREKYAGAVPGIPNAAAGLTAENTFLFIPAKTLKHKLQCGEELSFDHYPMTKIIDDIARLFTTN